MVDTGESEMDGGFCSKAVGDIVVTPVPICGTTPTLGANPMIVCAKQLMGTPPKEKEFGGVGGSAGGQSIAGDFSAFGQRSAREAKS